MAGDTISIKIKLDQAGVFAGDVREATVEVDSLGDAAARAERKSRSAGDGLNFLQKVIGLLKPAAIITGIGLLSQSLSALTSGAIGLVSAIAPVGGLIATLPGFALAAAQGFGVLKLATDGVMGALGGLTGQIDPTKFAALSRPAQDFVLTLNALKAPIIALQNRLQAGLFPGLTAGLNAARPALKVLTGPLTETAKVFGQLGDKLGMLVGSKGFLADLKSQAIFNNVQIGKLGDAGLHLLDAMRQITAAARPLVAWLVNLADGWAKSADKAAIAGRENGKLAAIFRVVKTTTSDVGTIIWNLGKALLNIGLISRKELGTSLLDSLVKGSKALDSWTKSSKGIQAIVGFFAQAKPVVYAVAKLLGAVVLAFLGLGSGGSGLARMFDTIRTQLLPVLTNLLTVITGIFGPPFIRALVAVGKALAALLGVFGRSHGPLVIFLGVITKVANAFTQISKTSGGRAIIIGLITAFAGYKVFGLAAAGVEAFSGALGGLIGFGALRGLAAMLPGVTAEMAASASMFEVLGVLATAAFGILTGGVGLAVLAIAGLAIGFVIAYTKVKWFHDAVDNVFGFLVAHWGFLTGIIGGPFVLVTGEIIKHLGTIKSAAEGILSSLGGVFHSVVGVIKEGINAVIGGINTLIKGYNDIPGVLRPTGKIALIPELGTGSGSSKAPTAIAFQGAGSGGYHSTPNLMSTPYSAPQPTLATPKHAKVTQAQLPFSRGGLGNPFSGPIVVHTTVKSDLNVDGQKLAENTNEVLAEHQALA